jgi:hypothetical protein
LVVVSSCEVLMKTSWSKVRVGAIVTSILYVATILAARIAAAQSVTLSGNHPPEVAAEMVSRVLLKTRSQVLV